MRRRRILLLLTFLVFLLLGALAYLQFFRLPWTRLNVLEAVPAQAAVFFHYPAEADTRGSFSEKLALLPDWTPGGADARACVSFTDTLARHFSSWEGNDLLVVLQAGGASTFNLLVVLETDQSAAIYDWLRTWEGAKETVFRKHPILTISPPGGTSFCVSQYRNLLMWAPFAFQVEDAIRQIENWQEALPRQPAFQKLEKSLPGGDSWQFFWNPAFLQGQFAPFLETQSRSEFSWLEGLPSWWGLQRTAPDTLSTWEGAVAVDAAGDLWSGFQPQDPLQFDQLTAILPADLAFVWSMQTEACPTLPGKEPAEAFYNRFLAPHLTGFYTLASPVVRGTEDSDPWMLLMQARDSVAWRSLIGEVSQKSGLLDEYTYQTYQVRQVLADIAFPFPGGRQTILLQNPFVVRIDDFVLWSGSRAALERWLDQYLIGQTLGLQEDFLRLQGSVSQEEAVSWMYAHPLEVASRLDPYLTAQAGVVLEKMRSVGPFFLRFRSENGLWRIAGSQLMRTTRSSGPTIAWKCSLEQEVASMPWVFQEPATGRAVLLVQDVAHQIYLLNTDGEILWKKPLNGRILSDVHAVDLFRTGEVQFVFNTRDAIFLLDKNGQSLRNFPLALQSPATNGLSVVDESGRGDYLIFVACQNEHVYGFDLEGRPLPGWNPKEGVGRVVHPVGFFQTQQQDFLYVLNQRGLLQVFSKKGDLHFDPLEAGQGVISPPQHQVHPLSTRIVTVDQSGSGTVVNQEGVSFRLNLAVGRSDFVHFQLADLLGDTRREYIVLSREDLAVYTYQKNDFKKAWTYRFPYPQDELFLLSGPSGKYPMIGTLSIDRKKIFLLDHLGRLIPGFPVAGTTAGSALPQPRDGSVLVLTGLGDAVYAYGVR